MSIVAADLICFAPASIPTDDTGNSGGNIDLTKRPIFTQFAANAVLALVSDGADTRLVDVVGRNAAGASVSETMTLNGAVEVLSVNTYERILSVTAQTTSGTRVVTAKQGSGGTTIGTIPVNEKGFYTLFQNAASEAGATARYELVYWKNTHGTLTLNSASMKLTADPAAKMKIACAASKGNVTAITNRKTVPAGTFVDDNVAQAVPTGLLAAAEYIGVWIEMSLGAGAAATKSTYTTELSGTSA